MAAQVAERHRTRGRRLATVRPARRSTAGRAGGAGHPRSRRGPASRLPPPGPVARADRLAAFRLLGSLHNLPDGAAQRAGPAGAHPRRTSGHGRRAPGDAAGGPRAARPVRGSRGLGIHRNTLAYRIGRMEATTGWRLDDAGSAVRAGARGQTRAKRPRHSSDATAGRARSCAPDDVSSSSIVRAARISGSSGAAAGRIGVDDRVPRDGRCGQDRGGQGAQHPLRPAPVHRHPGHREGRHHPAPPARGVASSTAPGSTAARSRASPGSPRATSGCARTWTPSRRSPGSPAMARSVPARWAAAARPASSATS